MAFGINRTELKKWKKTAKKGEIAILTHYWLDERFPDAHCVTKVGCCDVEKLEEWGTRFGLDPKWIDNHPEYPHFDLFGEKQLEILSAYKKEEMMKRFRIN
ncbi:hypothetical protein GJU40_00850 [Bacillus lacus]|uniref:YneQ n=1 Tax=Metabacillus lacus TaxID=1983721 RepID=A0A7X2LYA9_9BACI|nr:hypothetical protein [Metabacillus lacus]MRX70717.1 hypothetical protein [Metabacillus lacus]